MAMSYRDIAAPVLAISATAGVALLSSFARESEQRVFGILLGGCLGVALIIGWSLRRAARLNRVGEDAKRLLTADLPPKELTSSLTQSDDGSPNDEVSQLRQTLAQLARRVSGQVKELKKNSRNLEALVDAIQDPLIATNDNDEVLLCNAAAERFFAAGRGTLRGRPVRGLFTRKEVLELHKKAKGLTSGALTHTCVLTTETGPRTFEVAAAPLPNAWGEGNFGVLLFLRDITELSQAVSMQKDFVASASHELRTPIAAIRMAAETLEDGAWEDQPMRAKLFGTIDHHVHRLEETIRDLMDLSRMESTNMIVHDEPISLGEIESSLRQSFEPVCAERKLRLIIEVDQTLRGLVSDRRLLGLVLRNLIDNATKYAHEQTDVSVRMLRKKDPSGRDMMRMTVQDRGIGIPLSHQERVFERFYQVDPARTGFSSRRGTGLGLAIVKQAVQSLGGHVGLESVWGEGTLVWAEIPWKGQSGVAEASPHTAGTTPTASTEVATSQTGKATK
jgi:two-component system, OmpR family, phosphate regulon sensor histidine kinase PhoR